MSDLTDPEGLLPPKPLNTKAQMMFFHFYQAYKSCIRANESFLKPYGINPNQFFALHYLRYNADKPLTPTQLASMLALENNSITRLLDELEKKKLVKRRRSRSDRRVIKITLTDDGKEILIAIQPYNRAFIERLFADKFLAGESNVFIDMMQRVTDAGFAWQGIDPAPTRAFSEEVDAALKSMAETELAQAKAAASPAARRRKKSG
jgi:DNA-binding MarR family transcriptional regulator